MLSFVRQERLRWDNTVPSGDEPFSNPADFKILYNDWPYFIDQDITHLVVWTKFLINEDERTGEVTGEAKAMIEEFIMRTFCSSSNDPEEGAKRMDRDQITWFKNWKSLKSVHELGMWRKCDLTTSRNHWLIRAQEHFHIMLYKAPMDLLAVATNNDRPGYKTRTARSPASPSSRL